MPSDRQPTIPPTRGLTRRDALELAATASAFGALLGVLGTDDIAAAPQLTVKWERVTLKFYRPDGNTPLFGYSLPSSGLAELNLGNRLTVKVFGNNEQIPSSKAFEFY